MKNLCWIIICRPCSKHTVSLHQFINICPLADSFSAAWSRNIVPGWDISFYHCYPFQVFVPHCTCTIQTSIIPNCSCLCLFLTRPELLPNTCREPCLRWQSNHTYRYLDKQLCFLPSSFTVIILRLLCSNTLLDLILPKACSDFRNCFALTFPL